MEFSFPSVYTHHPQTAGAEFLEHLPRHTPGSSYPRCGMDYGVIAAAGMGLCPVKARTAAVGVSSGETLTETQPGGIFVGTLEEHELQNLSR